MNREISRTCENIKCGKQVWRTPGNFKKHTYCNKSCYWESGFQAQRLAANNPNPKPSQLTCTGCGVVFKRPPNKQKGKTHFHSQACRVDFRRRTAEPRLTEFGYVEIFVGPSYPGSNKSGHIFMHRKVMQEHLGRPLVASENVHHKNGVRDDNRLSNLELWSTAQPTGQRVVDKIAWAREFLAQYEGIDLEEA